MNRTTRASAASIALAAGLVLAACGQEADDNAAEFEPDTSATADEETPADESTDDADDTAADDTAGDNAADDDTADDDTTGDDSADDDAAGDNTAGDVPSEHDGVLAAIELAASEAGGWAYELDEDDGRWEIYVAVDGREVEVEVNREGTEVLNQDRDDDGLDSDEQAVLDAAGDVTMADALRLAIIEHGGTSEVEEIEADTRDGVPVWSVEFQDDVDVYVDPAAQQIVHVDR